MDTINQLVEWKSSRLYRRLIGRHAYLTTWSYLHVLMRHRSTMTGRLRTDRFGTDNLRVDDSRQVLDFLEIVGLLIIVCGLNLPYSTKVG